GGGQRSAGAGLAQNSRSRLTGSGQPVFRDACACRGQRADAADGCGGRMRRADARADAAVGCGGRMRRSDAAGSAGGSWSGKWKAVGGGGRRAASSEQGTTGSQRRVATIGQRTAGAGPMQNPGRGHEQGLTSARAGGEPGVGLATAARVWRAGGIGNRVFLGVKGRWRAAGGGGSGQRIAAGRGAAASSVWGAAGAVRSAVRSRREAQAARRTLLYEGGRAVWIRGADGQRVAGSGHREAGSGHREAGSGQRATGGGHARMPRAGLGIAHQAFGGGYGRQVAADTGATWSSALRVRAPEAESRAMTQRDADGERRGVRAAPRAHSRDVWRAAGNVRVRVCDIHWWAANIGRGKCAAGAGIGVEVATHAHSATALPSARMLRNEVPLRRRTETKGGGWESDCYDPALGSGAPLCSRVAFGLGLQASSACIEYGFISSQRRMDMRWRGLVEGATGLDNKLRHRELGIQTPHLLLSLMSQQGRRSNPNTNLNRAHTTSQQTYGFPTASYDTRLHQNITSSPNWNVPMYGPATNSGFYPHQTGSGLQPRQQVDPRQRMYDPVFEQSNFGEAMSTSATSSGSSREYPSFSDQASPSYYQQQRMFVPPTSDDPRFTAGWDSGPHVRYLSQGRGQHGIPSRELLGQGRRTQQWEPHTATHSPLRDQEIAPEWPEQVPLPHGLHPRRAGGFTLQSDSSHQPPIQTPVAPRRRPDVPSPAGPQGAPPAPRTLFARTYGDLLNQYLPRYTHDSSTSTSTASYSNNHPSPSPPRYSVPDPSLIHRGTERFITLLTQLRWMHGAIPDKVYMLWEDLEQALQNRYLGEDWVEKIAIKVVQILNALFDGLWEGAQCDHVQPDLKYSQRGDSNIVLSIGNTIAAVLAAEWKTSTVLDAHLAELLQPIVLAKGPEENGAAIAKKASSFRRFGRLSSHLNSAGPAHGHGHDAARRGRHTCVVAERLAANPPGYLAVPGIALSHPAYLNSRDDNRVPIFAVLMGLLAPNNVYGEANNVRHGPVRDPCTEQALKGIWMNTIEPKLFELGLLKRVEETSNVTLPSGSGPPPPPFGGGPGPSRFQKWGSGSLGYTSGVGGGSVHADGSSSATWSGSSRQYNFSDLLLHFDLPGLRTAPRLLMRTSRKALADRCRPPSAPSSVESSGSPSPTASTPPSSPASRHASCGPSDWSPLAAVRSDPCHVYLEGSVKSGNLVHVYRGKLQVDEKESCGVILKSYDNGHFAELIRELDAYTALSRLVVIVPQLYAVVGPPNHGYAALLLEDAGARLGRGESWEGLGLTKADKLRLYHALSEVHAAGVLHGDVFPRNVTLDGPLLTISVLGDGVRSFPICARRWRFDGGRREGIGMRAGVGALFQQEERKNNSVHVAELGKHTHPFRLTAGTVFMRASADNTLRGGVQRGIVTLGRGKQRQAASSVRGACGSRRVLSDPREACGERGFLTTRAREGADNGHRWRTAGLETRERAAGNEHWKTCCGPAGSTLPARSSATPSHPPLPTTPRVEPMSRLGDGAPGSQGAWHPHSCTSRLPVIKSPRAGACARHPQQGAVCDGGGHGRVAAYARCRPRMRTVLLGSANASANAQDFARVLSTLSGMESRSRTKTKYTLNETTSKQSVLGGSFLNRARRGKASAPANVSPHGRKTYRGRARVYLGREELTNARARAASVAEYRRRRGTPTSCDAPEARATAGGWGVHDAGRFSGGVWTRRHGTPTSCDAPETRAKAGGRGARTKAGGWGVRDVTRRGGRSVGRLVDARVCVRQRAVREAVSAGPARRGQRTGDCNVRCATATGGGRQAAESGRRAACSAQRAAGGGKRAAAACSGRVQCAGLRAAKNGCADSVQRARSAGRQQAAGSRRAAASDTGSEQPETVKRREANGENQAATEGRQPAGRGASSGRRVARGERRAARGERLPRALRACAYWAR
ncbi:hypothetical protein GGX14DRAFT_620594, partial [Mycena pura]